MIYDFTDPLIRQMVNRDHVPTEQRFTFARIVEVDVTCLRCARPWPCEARQALRQHEEGQS